MKVIIVICVKHESISIQTTTYSTKRITESIDCLLTVFLCSVYLFCSKDYVQFYIDMKCENRKELFFQLMNQYLYLCPNETGKLLSVK